MEFRWAPFPPADSYPFILSVDHWTVIGIRDGVEFTEAATSSLQSRQDKAAPSLEVQFPSGAVYAEELVLRGRTEPSSRLVIGGENVAIDPQGDFEHPIRLKPRLG